MNCLPDRRGNARARCYPGQAIFMMVRENLGARNINFPATLIDISAGACQIRTQRKLWVGLVVLVDGDHLGSTAEQLTGRVVWCQDDPTGYNAGIEFETSVFELAADCP